MAPQTLLTEFLPKGGFQWSAKSGAHFIKNSQARKVVHAMKLGGQSLDESVCTEYIAHLFNTAKDMVHHCQAFHPLSFWEFVSRHIPWAQRIDPGDLYDLSIRIISARRMFLDQRDYWVEMREEGSKDIPDSYFIRVFNEANTAVDSFTSAVVNTYGDHPKTKENYYPKWTDDSDNEGSAEATKARFRKNCEGPRNFSTGATVEDESNGLEGEYEKMVGMVGMVKMTDIMDEDMDGEMDYEMGDATDD
ncbi:hypothetical protein F4814DRAFT_452344 [Daldinia grandis]|nr:hypothetical protein F4814DRAFT_452344 [Daldinia grandis]